jgi:hypothetical protein
MFGDASEILFMGLTRVGFAGHYPNMAYAILEHNTLT